MAKPIEPIKQLETVYSIIDEAHSVSITGKYSHIKILISFKSRCFYKIYNVFTTYQFHHSLPAYRTRPSAVREVIVNNREFPLLPVESLVSLEQED